MTTVIKLDTEILDRLCKTLNKRKEDILRGVAFDVENEAKQLAPYDTTALKNSIYTVTKNEDGYAEAAGAAMGEMWKKKARIVETERHPKPDGNVVARVGPCVEYAAYVELGTSRMAGQPYLVPAVEHVSQRFNDPAFWKELFT